MTDPIGDARRRAANSRVPPYDEDAERGLLGAMLLHPAAATEAARAVGVGPESFYKPRHGHIADAIINLIERGLDVDPVSVTDLLRRNGIDLPIADLSAMVAGVPSSAHAVTYGRIVADHAALRRMIAVAGELAEMGYSAPADVPDAIERAVAMIGHLAGSGGRLDSVRMSDVTPEQVEWEWPGRLARSKITLCDGDPGLGKSTLTIDLAARMSTGSPMPDGFRNPAPADVVLLSAEDGLADTIAPRLLAHGADMTRIHAVRLEDDVVTLPEQILDLAALVKRTRARLLILDPLMAFLSPTINSYRDQDVRRVMSALAGLAARTRVAVLVIRHLTKQPGGPVLYRGGGSIGLIGAARVGLVVGTIPGSTDQLALAVVKCNLAKHAPTLAYRLVPDDLYDTVKVEWQGPVEVSAQDLVTAPIEENGGRKTSKVDRAAGWLIGLLSNGDIPAEQMPDLIAKAGFVERTIKRAKPKAGVVSVKRGAPGDADQGWFWSLNGQPPNPEECQHGPKGDTKKDVTLRPDLALFDDGGDDQP